jgi:hypothetical protein
MNPIWAKGLKGNLEANELGWVQNVFIPILRKSNLCTNEMGDCRVDHIICWSGETLSCDVYGISDERVIKEIFLAMLNSDLKVSSFNFWKNRYHETSLFERPLLAYTNRSDYK